MPTSISRRSVLANAAWTTPVVAVAVAAPAVAVSVCSPVTARLNWGSASYTRLSSTSGQYSFDPDGSGPLQPLVLTIQQTFQGSNTQTGNQLRDVNDNLRVTDFTVGGTGDTGLALHQSPINDGNKTSAIGSTSNRTSYSFTFSEPVTNLSFQIADIDSTAYDFVDAVAITSSSAYTYTKANPAYLGGTGTTADPFRPTYRDAPVENYQSSGNVTVRFPTVSSFSVTYWNLDSSWDSSIDGDQRIFFSDFTTTYTPC